MGFVPFEAGFLVLQVGKFSCCCFFQKGPVMFLPPIPLHMISFVKDYWDEIDGETVVMGALPFTRFARADGLQVLLPLGAAKCLVDFEAGLRQSGQMSPRQRICQSLEHWSKFRVEFADTTVDHIDSVVHEKTFLWGFGGERLRVGERASTLRCSEPERNGSREEWLPKASRVEGKMRQFYHELCIVRRSRAPKAHT